MTIKGFLPVFTGFYGTFFEYDEESDIENYNQENGTDLNYEDFTFDYVEYRNRIAQACVGQVEHELKDFNISIKFEEIRSPRFYNYDNDSIDVEYEINDSDFAKAITYLQNNIEEFRTYVSEHFSSRSGFVSFYETDLDVWFGEYLNPKYTDSKYFITCFSYALDFYLANEEYLEQDLYDNIVQERYIDFQVKEAV